MRKFGLIGYPLTHSFSNKYFTNKFKNEKLDDCIHEVYSIKSVDDIEGIINDRELEGLNVTIPYKKAIIPYIETLSEVVQKIQACNCIKIKHGKLSGHNTDVVGFEQSLMPLLKVHHVKALILGTGGASAAVEFVLAKYNIEYLFVSRSKRNNPLIITYEDIDNNLLQSHHLIINTTPLGTYPVMEELPGIPYHYLTGKHLLYDLIYNPAETAFLRKGREYGVAVKNGFEMLIVQAEESWKIWNA